MLNAKYSLTRPMNIEATYEDLDYSKPGILIRPLKLSVCKADMRYYFGLRNAEVLKQRLPMVLIHEACAEVLHDSSGHFSAGSKVVLLPNIPGSDDSCAENYRLDSIFRSSKADGFMQEMLLLPESQVVPIHSIPLEMAATTEFISVGVHAVSSFIEKTRFQHRTPERIAVWGDGALGYVICCVLRSVFPECHLTVIGRSGRKFDMFRFVTNCITLNELESAAVYDAVFECVGGQSSGVAISQMIDTIKPEGTITLLGVSEEPVPINTRMILEKGLTLIGRSRSGRVDFQTAVDLLENNPEFAGRMRYLVSDVVPIHGISDIYTAFEKAKNVDFKLIMDWKL